MRLDRRIKTKELRFKITVMETLMPQLVGRLDHCLLIQSDGFIAVIFEGVYNGQQRRRAIEAGERMVTGVHNFCAVLHRGDNAADFVAVRIMAVVMNQQARIFIRNRPYQFADAFGGTQSAVVLDGKQNVWSRDIQNLGNLFEIEFVGVFGPC